MRIIIENDFLFVLKPEFKQQYRAAVSKANQGDKEVLAEQHRLIEMLTNRINAHLGDGMPKPLDIKKGIIY